MDLVGLLIDVIDAPFKLIGALLEGDFDEAWEVTKDFLVKMKTLLLEGFLGWSDELGDSIKKWLVDQWTLWKEFPGDMWDLLKSQFTVDKLPGGELWGTIIEAMTIVTVAFANNIGG